MATRRIRRWKRRSRAEGSCGSGESALGFRRGTATSRPHDSGAAERGRPAVAVALVVAEGLRQRL
jgi:hypothetical protein